MSAAPPVTIAIYNDSSSGEKDADIAVIVAALQKHVSEHFSPIWHTGARLEFIPSSEKPPTGTWLLSVLNNSDQAGALGYHDLTPDGLPLGKVFAGTDRQYKEHVSVTLCHELDEMLADPWINLCAQADDGKFYALEVCDAVEADKSGYQIDGVLVSNFVTPHWFGHGAGPLDYLSQLSKPFQLGAGGYISVFDPSSGQGWQQVFGQMPSHSRAAIHTRPRVGSRRERRRTPRNLWQLSSYV